MSRGCKYLFASAVVTGMSIGLSHQSVADGYRNPPPTAEGIAKAGVNSVFVDDASAISYNPANLAMQEGASLVVAATLARAENEYNPPVPAGPFYSDDDWQVLPNVYYSQSIGDKLVAGLGITTPYGQAVSWNQNDFLPFVAADPVLYEASVLLININPTLAMEVMDGVYVGVGADIAYSELELNALFPTGIPVFPVADSKGDGDGWGFGGNIGVTWLPTDRQRLAFTYRSRMKIEYEGNFYLGGGYAGDFETEIKYPDTFGLGYGIQLTDTIQVEALVEWLEWSENDVQALSIAGMSMPQVNNWDDTFTYGVGGSWVVMDGLALRAGYAYLETPIPDATLNPLLVDTDRQVIGLGLGYSFGKQTIDVSYAYSIYDKRDTPSGSYDIDSDLAGVSYSVSF